MIQPEQQTLETEGIECRAYFWAARGDAGSLAGGFGQQPEEEMAAVDVPAAWIDDDGERKRGNTKKILYSLMFMRPSSSLSSPSNVGILPFKRELNRNIRFPNHKGTITQTEPPPPRADQFSANTTLSSLVDEFGLRRLGRRPGPYDQIPWRCKSASVRA